MSGHCAATGRAGVLLLPANPGLKCEIQALNLKRMETALEPEFFSRIISWRNSTVGGHSWQLALNLGNHHFCGGSLI